MGISLRLETQQHRCESDAQTGIKGRCLL